MWKDVWASLMKGPPDGSSRVVEARGGCEGEVALEAVSRHGPGSLHARPY